MGAEESTAGRRVTWEDRDDRDYYNDGGGGQRQRLRSDSLDSYDRNYRNAVKSRESTGTSLGRQIQARARQLNHRPPSRSPTPRLPSPPRRKRSPPPSPPRFDTPPPPPAARSPSPRRPPTTRRPRRSPSPPEPYHRSPSPQRQRPREPEEKHRGRERTPERNEPDSYPPVARSLSPQRAPQNERVGGYRYSPSPPPASPPPPPRDQDSQSPERARRRSSFAYGEPHYVPTVLERRGVGDKPRGNHVTRPPPMSDDLWEDDGEGRARRGDEASPQHTSHILYHHHHNVPGHSRKPPPKIDEEELRRREFQQNILGDFHTTHGRAGDDKVKQWLSPRARVRFSSRKEGSLSDHESIASDGGRRRTVLRPGGGGQNRPNPVVTGRDKQQAPDVNAYQLLGHGFAPTHDFFSKNVAVTVIRSPRKPAGGGSGSSDLE